MDSKGIADRMQVFGCAGGTRSPAYCSQSSSASSSLYSKSRLNTVCSSESVILKQERYQRAVPPAAAAAAAASHLRAVSRTGAGAERGMLRIVQVMQLLFF
jgi:hypothetical protein